MECKTLLADKKGHYIIPGIGVNAEPCVGRNAVHSSGCNAVHGNVGFQALVAMEVAREPREDNSHFSVVAIPKRYKLHLLPIVIIIEIIEMLVVTGAVAFTIVTTRILTIGWDLGKAINTEFTKCLLILAYLQFAQKWKKLMPVISFACYLSIAFVCFYNVYLFCTCLSCHNDKDER